MMALINLVEGLIVEAPIVALKEFFLNFSFKAANSFSLSSAIPRVLTEVEFLRVSLTKEESSPLAEA